ncbi:DHH family phosphoesterase [Actinokineospora iranica]|uniref:Phosphoesterase RecJ domain-containing protein n=1 Tax=Actinokineospora iranica TaxID=1271860 RepID=A0A1G6KL65_9PSEU|nr:bifunctional oligoribonuclease/PAP phosphatase NrnA [Actinokineospora iranica]SDC31677.1 phosphoesterase RecJ domain-containing protein [Actinokineospora iranica]
MGTDLAAAADLLRSATDVTLLAHVNPDADALGSAVALGLALRARGATARVSFGSPAEVPRPLRGLDPAGLIVPAAEVPAAPPLLVALDCGGLNRLGALADRVSATIAAGGRVLVVDHHVGTPRFGTHHVIDETALATAVLVLDLIDALPVPLDPAIAKCLYAGLVTDTGSFRRATPETHRIAARLLSAGVDPTALTRELMDTNPFAWLRMVAAALARAELVPDAAGGLGLVQTVVYAADLEGLSPQDADAVVDLLRTTAEAEVAVVAKETAPGHWSVSLRAVGAVDVRAAAMRLGGGGHRLAAGFTAVGSAEDVLVSIKNALR